MSVRRFSIAFALPFLIVLLGGIQSVQAASVSYTTSSFECVQIATVSGGSWSSSSSAAFQMVVTSSGGSVLYDEVGSEHAGSASGGNIFYTACNICRVNEDLAVTFNVPDPLMYQNGQPFVRYFSSQSTDQSRCPSGGLGVGGIADIPQVAAPVLAPFVLVTSLIGIAFALRPFNPRPFQIRPFEPQGLQGNVGHVDAKTFDLPTFRPTPIDERLTRLSTGITHEVPADAPMQALPSQYPEGYPYPTGTHSATTCKYCHMPTLCPFTDGWFCTNLQCPARTGNATQFVGKQWFQ